MKHPLRILLAALGGEGGGVLMNWIVQAARESGHQVQATSVPGVAQRTGSTTYYLEIAPKNATDLVLGLVPMAGRVDIVVSSELVETARVMAAGFVSPERTTLISSTARFYSTAEKIALGDGRFDAEAIKKAAKAMSKDLHLLDLEQLASDHNTFVSATMFGALAGCGVLPWNIQLSRSMLGDKRSQDGFDAAVLAVSENSTEIPMEAKKPNLKQQSNSLPILPLLPDELAQVIVAGIERCDDFQDIEYAEIYKERVLSLIKVADLENHRAVHTLVEACRRLALWMTYEDIARVADLKTRSERFDQIADEVKLVPGQALKITEYLKPRSEELADIMPVFLGKQIMKRVNQGKWMPFGKTGIRLQSNGVWGFWLLRLASQAKHWRRKSYRFAEEEAAITEWLDLMRKAFLNDLGFAQALAEMPRLLKGYSDTLIRGKRAYAEIIKEIVLPSVELGHEAKNARALRDAIGAALADDNHTKLDAHLSAIKEKRKYLSPEKTAYA